MTAKTIKLPALPAGLTITVQVRNISTLTVLETVACTEASGVYTGTIAGAHAGQLLFVILSSGLVLQSRVRTIQDVAATFVILTELEELAAVDTGPSALTLTITDGVDPVAGATIRVSGPGIVRTKTSNGSGVVLFALADEDYDVVVTKPGFDSEYVVVTVLGTTSQTIALTEVAVTPPASVYLSTGIGLVLNQLGVFEVGVSVSIQLESGPGTAGYILDQKIRTDVSDAAGLVEFPGMIRGATYAVWRGVGTADAGAGPFSTDPLYTRKSFVVPNTDTFSLAEALGIDAEV